jgi:hypothetical protein
MKEMHYSSDSLGDHMALKAYANKLGPKHIDRHDLLTAASHMAFGNMDHLKKHLKALDTDVRDKALEYVARRHYAELGYGVRKEEADIDEANSHREVDNLKSKGKHHEAGQHAAKSGHDRQYGAHFGMRSDKEEAQRQFFKGYDSVKKTNEEADLDEALGTIKNMKAASKFGSSNVSDMIRGEKARKAGMAKVSTTKDIGYKVVDVGPGQKETIRKMHNFKEEPDQIDENFGGQFKDSSEWENAAKKRGLVVKLSTHPSGEVIKYQIAKDKSGNNRGHFDHGTKSGRLTEESKQIDELKHSGGVLNNYLSKTNPDRNTPEDNVKRAAGRGMALRKKWGKALGVNEPKVPATNEEIEPLAEISAALARRASRASMDE